MSTEATNFDDIQDAAHALDGMAVKTPLLRNRFLDEFTGRSIFLKPEQLQVSGSFKFRGAYNRISRLTSDERSSGVIAWSSGNHAQGVAAAATLNGIRARIVMPEDAPVIKLENTRALGAQIITYDRYSESREEIAYALAEKEGGVIVPSFDDRYIIAGQGTAGLEIFRQAEEYGEKLDAMLVCCGGGGLTAGCALAGEALSPNTDFFAIEPESYDDHLRSLQSGVRQKADTSQRSICDALLSPEPGEMTFPINQRLLKGVLVVTEDEVRDAMRYAFRVLKLVVEPGGAVALAALLSGKLDQSYKRVGIMMSGGNVDPGLFAETISGG
ncbi:MAG: threonine/serine dehydratase [Pseudomonadota bacterium]